MFYYLKWCPRVFPPSFFLSCEEFLFFVMWNISLTPQRPPDAAQRWMVSSIFPAVGVPLLQLSPSSISACWNVLHGVCTSRDASPVSPAEPQLPPPSVLSLRLTSQWDLQLYYLLASNESKTRATSIWDQRRMWMLQFSIYQKYRRK